MLEFGSGRSTTVLTRRYRVVSVEDNPAYVGACRRTEYVHAPLVRQRDGRLWYDANVVIPALRGRRFDLVVVDGPVRQWNRRGILDYACAIDLSGCVVIDDLQRQHGVEIAEGIARHVGRPYTKRYCDERAGTRWGTKSYATIDGRS